MSLYGRGRPDASMTGEGRPRYKCLNCGVNLGTPSGGIDARRFCSERCKSQYLE